MAAKQKSGGARLIEAGKKPVTLGLSAEDYDELKEAAISERVPLTVFFLRSGLEVARRISRKKQKSG
jgi:uncharacterized protein (DUF1778 family)